MTATGEQTVKRPPRILVHTFWRLHRAAYRLTGGRFGLNRPAAGGGRFGMMRLATVGRRSGRARVAIVGYFEDGPNLVTLAMNGWGESDPAWWLNLQAQPETVVGLADGTRAVRARVATGDERARLWPRFRDYPGWGDVEALAAQRSRETAVVVLEPLSGATAREGVRTDAGSAPNDLRGAAAVAGGHARPQQGARRLRPRLLWIVPGLAIAVSAGLVAEQHGLGILPALLFGIAPDVPRLLGLGQPRAAGQMALRVVPLFNGLHHPVPPLAVLAAAVLGLLPPFLLVGSLAWLGHILIGWGVGDVRRTADGYTPDRVPVGGRTRRDRPSQEPAGSAA